MATIASSQATPGQGTSVSITFVDWLRLQVERNDPIGDLANDATGCADFGIGIELPRPNQDAKRERESWIGYLSAMDACHEMRTAFVDAWQEYEAYRRSPPPTPASHLPTGAMPIMSPLHP